MQVVTNTINRRVRCDTHFFETYVRSFRSIGKSANIDCQKFVYFFIRVFFRFSKTFIPFTSCFWTKFQQYNKNNYMILFFTGDPKFANAASAAVTVSRNLFNSTIFSDGWKTNERFKCISDPRIRPSISSI